MKEIIKKLVANVEAKINEEIKSDLVMKAIKTNVLELLLKAYNDYQECYRDGVDYIFDINNPEDLKCCIDGGMTAKDIAEFVNGCKDDHIQYFFFGVNHPTPKPIRSHMDLGDRLSNWLEILLEDIITYPCAYESYKNVYYEYITKEIELLKDYNQW